MTRVRRRAAQLRRRSCAPPDAPYVHAVRPGRHPAVRRLQERTMMIFLGSTLHPLRPTLALLALAGIAACDSSSPEEPASPTASLATAAPLAAATPTVFATGLRFPRGFTWGPDGSLYVAEAGSGGTHTTTPGQCAQVVPPVGPYTNGATARSPGSTPTGAAPTSPPASPRGRTRWATWSVSRTSPFCMGISMRWRPAGAAPTVPVARRPACRRSPWTAAGTSSPI